MLEKLKRLLASESTADIKKAIAEVDLNDLRADLAAAERRRADLLLSGDDRQILAAETVISKARIALDRATAATAALDQKLALALAKDADDAFTREYAATERKCDAVRKELSENLPKVIAELHRIGGAVQDCARARLAIYKLRCEAGETDTAAGRASDIPSPIVGWDSSGLPPWVVNAMEGADRG